MGRFRWIAKLENITMVTMAERKIKRSVKYTHWHTVHCGRDLYLDSD